jgi:hypothetical protein
MPFLSEPLDPLELNDRLHDAHAITTELFSVVVSAACRRFPSAGQAEKTAKIERLVASQAWTDAVLALIDLELPQWQVRRIVYDEGEWHCALSRERELPEWLDQAIESHHTDLALAILSAFVDVQRISAPSTRPSVPIVQREASALYQRQPLCCDNFA